MPGWIKLTKVLLKWDCSSNNLGQGTSVKFPTGPRWFRGFGRGISYFGSVWFWPNGFPAVSWGCDGDTGRDWDHFVTIKKSIARKSQAIILKGVQMLHSVPYKGSQKDKDHNTVDYSRHACPSLGTFIAKHKVVICPGHSLMAPAFLQRIIPHRLDCNNLVRQRKWQMSLPSDPALTTNF